MTSVDETIEFPTGGDSTSARAHVVSAAGGAGLGVVVIPDEGGFTPHIRRVCDDLVDEGFTALAPDTESLVAAGDVARAARELAGAVDLLCTHQAVRGDGVGVLGFARGAGLALWLAALRPEKVRAVVPFYGLPSADREPDWARIRGAIEGHFAEHDDLVAPDAVEALEHRLDDLDKDARMFTYPGARHGFFDNTRAEGYDGDAAHLAWVRTLEFLRAKLG